MASEIKIGDLFWDEHHRWSDGSNTIDLCYLVLSADRLNETLYCCDCFMWVGDGYSIVNNRNFTTDEILKMTKVGNIAQIKSFN